MSEIKLKPCPFCGSKAELLIVPGKMTKWVVRCTKCYANNGTFASDHDAREAWNKRAELPSAQPEIVRCCKCGFWDRDTLMHQFNDFREWNEAECKILAERDPYNEINRYTEEDDFCSYAERRTDEPEQRWIPCSERLPDMTTDVLVTVGVNNFGEGMHTEVRTALWNTVYKRFYVHERDAVIVGEAQAWMPLPEPYCGAKMDGGE